MEPILFSFALGADAAAWRPIDDGVMGGLSRSEATGTGRGTLLFSGTVSLENNGGFASVRSTPRRFDLAGTRGVAVRVKGDGKAYKLNVKTDEGFDGVQYQARFEPDRGEWRTVEIPWDAFEPRFRGRPVPGAQPLDPARIAQVGLMIADRQAGPFALEVEWIAGLPATR